MADDEDEDTIGGWQAEMRYDFDQIIERRSTDSAKWRRYGEDVLPLWVADMDFTSPQPVIDALRQRVDHGIFGYAGEPPELRAVIQDRLKRVYGWEVATEDMVFVTSTVLGLNLACRAVGEAGDGILMQTPIYPPFLAAPIQAGRVGDEAPLRYGKDSYETDFEVFEEAINPRTKLFALCNPHNPTGRVFTRVELEKMAEVCLRHDVVICSDEVHRDILYEGHQHTPMASLDPEIARRTITLFAPSKTYNLPGLHFSVAVIPNPELRQRFVASGLGMAVNAVNTLGYVAGVTAFRDGDDWLAQLRVYLQGNRDYAVRFISDRLPGVQVFEPQGTYLAWLDCREAGMAGSPYEFFLNEAKVALNDGAAFGKLGEGFVRLNFGCPRSILEQALNKMEDALRSRS